MSVAAADTIPTHATVSPARITEPAGAGDQLLYFTSTSLTADDGTAVLIRQVDGHPNLVACDLATGTTRPLTHNASGYLKSYVYFDGRPNEGFGKASVSLDPGTGRAYYLQGLQLRCVDVRNGAERTLATLPDDEVTAFTHVSADGRLLCVPTADARALEGDFPGNRPAYDIDGRVQAEGLRSYLNVYDTTTGELVARETVERGWITHVQFSPTEPGLVLYNHEWPGDCGVRRIWLWDGTKHHSLRDEGDGRSRRDWVCHEMWSRDGRSVIYHGRYAGTASASGNVIFGAGNGASFIGRCDPDGSNRVEIALPDAFTRYGHFTVGPGDWLVTDGYWQQPDDPPGEQGAWIALLRPDWSRRTIEWRPVCQHGSSWKSQDEHPHPIFDHAGRRVFFTSDAGGRRAVYRVSAHVGPTARAKQS